MYMDDIMPPQTANNFTAVAPMERIDAPTTRQPQPLPTNIVPAPTPDPMGPAYTLDVSAFSTPDPITPSVAPSANVPQAPTPATQAPETVAPETPPQGYTAILGHDSTLGPAVVLTLTPEGYAYFAPPTAPTAAPTAPTASPTTGGEVQNADGPKASEINKAESCQTCRERRYVDQSNDSSVSFQTPTKISPNAAASAVSAHEREHVRNNQAEAEREDRKVVSQSVTIHTSICPECGTVYVSGGTTRTVTKNDDSDEQVLREDANAPEQEATVNS
jgi:hypothetical protein